MTIAEAVAWYARYPETQIRPDMFRQGLMSVMGWGPGTSPAPFRAEIRAADEVTDQSVAYSAYSAGMCAAEYYKAHNGRN